MSALGNMHAGCGEGPSYEAKYVLAADSSVPETLSTVQSYQLW